MTGTDLPRQIIEALNTSTILAITDKNGIITYANEAFCRISKFAHDELLGQSHRIVNSGYHSNYFFQNMWKSVNSGEIWQGEICNQAKDGSYYWTFATIIPIKDSKHNVFQFVTLQQEITEQKEQEFSFNLLQKLQSSLFNKTLDTSVIGAEICKLVLEETKASWAFLGIYGESEKAQDKKSILLDQVWIREFSTTDKNYLTKVFQSKLKVDESAGFLGMHHDLSHPLVLQQDAYLKVNLPPRLKTLKLINYICFPLYFGTERIGFLGIANSKMGWPERRVSAFSPFLSTVSQTVQVAIDKKKKKQYRERLQTQEAQVLNFIDHLPIPVAILDPQLRILVVSQEWKKVFMPELSLPQNRDIHSFFPTPPQSWNELFHKALRGITLKSPEEQVTTETGRTLWIEWMVGPWLNESKIGGIVIVANNQTEQRELHTELEHMRYQQLLTSKMASLGEMAGGIAHEINNPLMIIDGLAEQLIRYSMSQRLTPEYLKGCAEKIHQTTHRIGGIVKGLKMFARDGQHDPMIFSSLNQIIQDSLPYLESKFEKYAVRWSWHSSQDCQIECRPVQVSQVLVNIISNACDAIKDLKERWITLQMVPEATGVSIEITDSGTGISKAIAEKIMEPFFTTKEIGKGTGLGLSISKSIIESHQGLLLLDDHSPHTKFIIRLPYNQQTSLTIRNGNEAISFHLAWKQRFLNYVQNPNFEVAKEKVLVNMKEWMAQVKLIYEKQSHDPRTASVAHEVLITLFETHHLLTNEVLTIFELLENKKRDVALAGLTENHSEYCKLSKTMIAKILQMERLTLSKKQTAA